MHNLYGDPKYRKIQKQMHRRLRQLQKQYDDPIEKELKTTKQSN